MEWTNMDVLKILQIGVIGLGFLLAALAYHLLTKEQKHETPRPDILKSIYFFMSFSVVLCVIGIISQTIGVDIGRQSSPSAFSSFNSKRDSILYNYFVYSVDAQNHQLCNTSRFLYSEKPIDTENMSIEGKIIGELIIDKKSDDFEYLAFGNKNKYFLKILHDDGVAFLESEAGDYIGYWIGEANAPGINAVICPIVFSPDAKGLSVEEAKSKWSILNDPCRILTRLNEISK
ncbi:MULTISPECIES: hypothetical protein [Desulfosediminicola]|uniref:hypothetical protein n=1 Tax=Desulfosediminicola TaxID=2886823 RepID=UPI0010AB50E0|nr:hypothetical protein [Desulfosediminicola ganghwensis]